MKILSRGKDGGPDSTVWGFWLVEIKPLFSIALLCFEKGSRDAFHEHAFHSISWVLKGLIGEHIKMPYGYLYKQYGPSLRPIWTSRSRLHKVYAFERTWALTFRGPWKDTWREWLPKSGQFQTLTYGRRIVTGEDC